MRRVNPRIPENFIVLTGLCDVSGVFAAEYLTVLPGLPSQMRNRSPSLFRAAMSYLGDLTLGIGSHFNGK